MKRSIRILFILLATAFEAYASQFVSDKILFEKILWNEKLTRDLLQEYIHYVNVHPDNYTVLWHISRLTYYMALREMNKDHKKVFNLVKIGSKFAKSALKVKSNGPEATYWYIMNLTIVGTIKGPLQALSLVREIKGRLKLMLKRDKEAKFMNGSWLRLLGREYLFSPPFPVGFWDPEKGLALIKEAVNKYPEEYVNSLYLAVAFAITGKLEDAFDTLSELEKKLGKRYQKNFNWWLIYKRSIVLKKIVATCINSGKKRIPPDVIRKSLGYGFSF